jgi:hypothetical protein
MSKSVQKLEVEGEGDKIQLTRTYNTDEDEREAARTRSEIGKGIILDKDGRGRRKILGRRLLSIPVEDAAMLRATRDLDWLAFELSGDRNALRRLIKRFPYWQVCDQGI